MRVETDIEEEYSDFIVFEDIYEDSGENPWRAAPFRDFCQKSLRLGIFSKRSPIGQFRISLNLSRFSKRIEWVWFVTMRLKFW